MRTLLLLAILVLSLHAREYIYKLDNTGTPISRIKESTGVYEIYTNLYKMKPSSKELKLLHKKSYKDISYSEFLKKLSDVYGKDASFKIKGLYRWIDFNEYNKIKNLNNYN